MIFTRLGENEIRCVLSEEEFISFGIDLDDILEKNVKSGRFFNEILTQAMEALGEKDARIRGCSAQINVMEDRSISILFHTRRDDPLSMYSKKLMEAEENLRKAAKSLEKAADSSSLLISFKSLEDAVSFCKSFGKSGHIVSRLFKNRKSGDYLLFLLRYACDEDLFNALKIRGEEFGQVNPGPAASKVYLMDNSDLIIPDDAFYALREEL